MNYKEAFRLAAFSKWGGVISNDTICGNGFQIAGYGLKLIGKYVIAYLFRFLVAALAPISAFALMWVHKRNQQWAAEARRKAYADL